MKFQPGDGVLRGFGLLGETGGSSGRAASLDLSSGFQQTLSKSREVKNAPTGSFFGAMARFRRNFRRFWGFFGVAFFAEKEGRLPDRSVPVEARAYGGGAIYAFYN